MALTRMRLECPNFSYLTEWVEHEFKNFIDRCRWE